jgi:hypothetical protein
VDLNHDNELGARAGLIRDQALSTRGHVGVTPALFDRDPDGPSGEIAAPLSPGLVFPARMAQRGLRERDPPAGSVGRAPDDGAESPMLVMDPALSIDSHGSRLLSTWDGWHEWRRDGTVAAPAFGQIMSFALQYLRIPPG